MVILVVLMYLRYGCCDPKFMVNVIRCAALELRTTNENLFFDFLERLRGWQNLGTSKNLALDSFQSLLLRMNFCHGESVPLGHF